MSETIVAFILRPFLMLAFMVCIVLPLRVFILRHAPGGTLRRLLLRRLW